MSSVSLMGLPRGGFLCYLVCLLCGDVITPGSSFQLTKSPTKEVFDAGRRAPPRREPIQTTAPSDEAISKMWEHFKENRKLNASQQHHFEAFKANVLRAHSLNDAHGMKCTDLTGGGPDCIFGITKFSHMKEEDFRTSRLGFKPNTTKRNSLARPPVLNLKGMLKDEDSVDWRNKNAVTPVKDQYMCGSCWAMAAVSEIESSVAIATGRLQELSTQQVISCDPIDWGCEGGDTTSAYDYVAHAGGIDTAADYPDHSHATGLSGTCEWHGSPVAAKISGYEYAVEPCWDGACQNQDEDRLAQVVAEKGPVSICVMADEWMYYTGGVFNSQTCSGAADMLDHCVQLVGYNKEEETPYWIIRNSWNTDWGMDGYIYLAMGSNLCGVADEAQLAIASL